jgi:hypothetical protein
MAIPSGKTWVVLSRLFASLEVLRDQYGSGDQEESGITAQTGARAERIWSAVSVMK